MSQHTLHSEIERLTLQDRSAVPAGIYGHSNNDRQGMNGPPPVPSHSSHHDKFDIEEMNESDSQPLTNSSNNSMNQASNNQSSRPVSLFLYNGQDSVRSQRPSNFVKPTSSTLSGDSNSTISHDMRIVQTLYENYAQKVYFEGYVWKRNDLTVDGKPCAETEWQQWYVELCGPVLALWDVSQQNQNDYVMPQYINITDSDVQLLGQYEGRQNVFALNSAGANRYLFDVVDYQTLISWVCAIRLSCFECCKLQEIFTRRFLTRSTFSDIVTKPINKMEGFVQVRFSGTTEWRKFWVVVSDRKEEKKLFGKKSIQSTRGQMMFYESKKSKQPSFTMVNVVQSYILYPESPQAIDLVSIFKVEGSTFAIKPNGEQQRMKSYSSVLIMASSPKEVVQWLIGTLDTFKLYGRPACLSDDPFNINSLNFGEPSGDMPRLFLEVPEVIHLNFKDDTLLDNKAQFAGILLNKIQYQQQQQQQQQQRPQSYTRQMRVSQQQPMGLIHQIPNNNGKPIYNNNNGNTNNVQSQRGSVYSSHSSNTNRSSLSHQRANLIGQKGGRQVYASDDDEDEDEEEVEDEDNEDDSDDDDDDKALFTANGTLKRPITEQPERQNLLLPNISCSDDLSLEREFLASMNNNHPSKMTMEKTGSTLKQENECNSEVVQPPKNDLSVSDKEEEQEPAVTKPTHSRLQPKLARTQISLSGSEEEDDSEENNDDDEASYSGSDDDDDDVPIQQQQQKRLLQQQQLQQQFLEPHMQFQQPMQGSAQWDSASMYDSASIMNQQRYGTEEDVNGGLAIGYAPQMLEENGPIIPQLGDHFATPNSLMDTYRSDRTTAHEQEGFARATGQPLIQVPNKPPEPRAGLVGMISQIEHGRKQKDVNKNRMMEMEKELLMQQEREKYLMEQRSQMMQHQQPAMMGQPMMMYPGMNPAMMHIPNGQMPVMNMMGQPMMYPGVMPMGAPGMMNMAPMMTTPPMMDPRMSILMMQSPYAQYPMWQQQQQMMYGNSRFNGQIQEEEDEDDDVPLGAAKDTSRNSGSRK